MALSLKELISICEEQKALIPVASHKFVDDMILRRERFGESLYASPRQLAYLRKLIARFHLIPDAPEDEPKSRIQQLREKRDALLAASKKRAVREMIRQADEYSAATALLGGELRVVDAPTAKIRHDRSRQLERMNNPSPVKAVSPR